MPYLLIGEPCFEKHASALETYGFTPVPLPADNRLNKIVSTHADTLIYSDGENHIINEDYIKLLPKEVQSRLTALADFPYGNYPSDTAFNALAVGCHLFARLQSLAPSVRQSAEASGLTLVNVSQGYTRCSVLALRGVRAAITADEGLSKVMESKGIRVLRISSGNIKLEGCEYGFIGGASFVYEPQICCTARVQSPTVYFFGNIHTHPDSARIREFLSALGYDIICLDGTLTDFGGGVMV